MIVIGAGLGGLCLAQGLRRAGIDVAVHERDSTSLARAQGHRLHIDARGRHALAATLPPHLFELIAAIAGRPAPVVHGFDHQLRPTGVVSLDDPASEPHPGSAPLPAHTVLDRHVLRQILLDGLDDTVHFDHHCVGYDSDPTVVTARFSDGSTASGSVLVAADGIGSVIRGRRLPEAQIMDTQARLIYGRVPLTSGLRRILPSKMISVFNSVTGPDRRFVGIAPVQYHRPPAAAAGRLAPRIKFAPISDSLAVMFGARLDLLGLSEAQLRAASGPQLQELVRKHITAWHPLLTQLVESWEPASVHPVTVRSSIPISPWPTSNITFLGDAIHAMSPAAGAGANIALRDAAALTSALTEAAAGRPVHAALHGYEQTMIEDGFRAVRLSAANGTRTLGADPLPD